jgi:hypothetical protein
MDIKNVIIMQSATLDHSPINQNFDLNKSGQNAFTAERAPQN